MAQPVIDYMLLWRAQQLTDQDMATINRKLTIWRFNRSLGRLGDRMTGLAIPAAAAGVAVAGFAKALVAAQEAQAQQLKRVFRS